MTAKQNTTGIVLLIAFHIVLWSLKMREVNARITPIIRPVHHVAKTYYSYSLSVTIKPCWLESKLLILKLGEVFMRYRVGDLVMDNSITPCNDDARKNGNIYNSKFLHLYKFYQRLNNKISEANYRKQYLPRNSLPLASYSPLPFFDKLCKGSQDIFCKEFFHSQHLSRLENL